MRAYSPLDNFEVLENSLCISKRSIVELHNSGIATPFYVYSKEVISKKLNELKTTFLDEIKFYYSIKANPFGEIISFLEDYIDGYDVSSIHELNLALKTNINGNNICYTGPGKSNEELHAAITNKVLISAESKNELDRIEKIGEQLKIIPTVLIRVNPNFTQQRAGMKMASGSSPFGIDCEQVVDILKWSKTSSLSLEGFHIYYGSQILDADSINQSQIKIFSLLNELANNFQQVINTINIGGGFGIPYFPHHTPLDLKSVASNINDLLPTLSSKYFSEPVKPILELGRYIVGESGIYVCKILDKKISRGKIYLVTDGGMHHHLAASGNLGQRKRKNFPIIIANKVQSDEQELVNIVGKLCTPLDKVAEDITISKASVGDYVAIMQSGAYGLSASPNNFLSHPVAKEILI